MFIVSVIATYSGTEDIKEKVYNQLTAINQIKKQAIQDYFRERRNDIDVLSDTADTLTNQAFLKLANTQDLIKAQVLDHLHTNKQQLSLLASQASVKSSLKILSMAFNSPLKWQTLLERSDDDYLNITKHFGWSDFFLINLEGDIVYSAKRESDLGQNLVKDLSDTSFNQAFSLAQTSKSNQVWLSDYQPYAPTNNAPEAFGVVPVFDGNKRLGYIAFQKHIEKINEILSHRVGMGETGESYLVGQDSLMRSDSYLNPAEYSIKASFKYNNKVTTRAAINGLSGQKGTGIIFDYNDNPVLSSWDFIEVEEGVRWALISEIDLSEALNPKTSKNEEFYQHYIEHYGYYDLFLIQPDGNIFYSVKKDATLHTNILTGPYADTNLAQLIRQVDKTGRFSMIDYAPYEPNDNEPAAFIAKPVKDNRGNTLLYLALELPTEGVTHIMESRKGMGETGESFLVGPDLKMRSNAYLDPVKHNIKASLLGTVSENGIDSKIVRQALAGQSGTASIIDYRGHAVLSSYDRIKFDNFSWAIVSEVDEAEAFASTYKNIYLIGAIMLLSVVLIGALGFLVAKGVRD